MDNETTNPEETPEVKDVQATNPEEATLQAKPKLERPVNPDGKLIRIIGPNCEFCGINASKCEHSEAFRATGMLQKSEAMKEENKLYQNFPGLPKVISKICEFCGVDAGKCAHAEERRKLAKLAPDRQLKRVERDPVTGAQIHIEEPEDMGTTEETHTGEAAEGIKAQVEAQKAENATRDAAPSITDEQAGDALEGLSKDEGVGAEDVDLES